MSQPNVYATVQGHGEREQRRTITDKGASRVSHNELELEGAAPIASCVGREVRLDGDSYTGTCESISATPPGCNGHERRPRSTVRTASYSETNYARFSVPGVSCMRAGSVVLLTVTSRAQSHGVC